MFPIIQDHIVIPITPLQDYNIPISKCDNMEKVLGWVIHLLEKSWVTKEIIDKFIQTALNHHNLTRPQV